MNHRAGARSPGAVRRVVPGRTRRSPTVRSRLSVASAGSPTPGRTPRAGVRCGRAPSGGVRPVGAIRSGPPCRCWRVASPYRPGTVRVVAHNSRRRRPGGVPSGSGPPAWARRTSRTRLHRVTPGRSGSPTRAPSAPAKQPMWTPTGTWTNHPCGRGRPRPGSPSPGRTRRAETPHGRSQPAGTRPARTRPARTSSVRTP